MPGELWTSQSRAKEITTLKVHSSVIFIIPWKTTRLITIAKVEGKLRWTIQEFKSPVIISTLSHMDSDTENIQWMYMNRSIDFEGLAQLPQGNTAIRIKPCKLHVLRAMADDSIVLSSREDMSEVVKPAKKSKSKPATSKTMLMMKKGNLSTFSLMTQAMMMPVMLLRVI
ncbi:hypothetical protein JVT61DRAFT_6404 [Boletus reticuloceps]|uniref:Uncharacterized protein n=1 Tax=Boletus reticuloceps TaxID=495285 RepID=A0A8I3A694_9AGAM|nr:hypothetical protein JVT61DRAFT_6404 [Boletus reticuloceps]